jgi:hypothetical protein
MKILNPNNRWKKILAFRETKKIKALKERMVELYVKNSDHYAEDAASDLKVALYERLMRQLKENSYHTHNLSPCCFTRKFKACSWRTDVWRGACHWVSRVYLEYARKAYPEYYWYRVEGSKHSTVLGFKQKQDVHSRWGFEHKLKKGDIVPDAAYDPLAWYLKLDPYAWAVEGKEVELS